MCYLWGGGGVVRKQIGREKETKKESHDAPERMQMHSYFLHGLSASSDLPRKGSDLRHGNENNNRIRYHELNIYTFRLNHCNINTFIFIYSLLKFNS